MATIVERPKADGSITFQVRWRLGGGRQSPVQTEKFAEWEHADTFRQLVELHTNQWPPGWVRGKGFVEEPEHPNDAPLLDWAYRYVDNLTGTDMRTREDYRREIRIHFALIQHTHLNGQVVPATIANLTQYDVNQWAQVEQEGEPAPAGSKREWTRLPADPKSIRNRHGLLYCVVQAAVESKPQIRTDNCCTKTSLPRADVEIVQDMTFLEREEYQRITAEITDPDARLMADWLVGTGMRWGEASALQTRDCHLTAARPYVDVQRAWKKAVKGRPRGEGFYLGPPKTKRGRRRIYLTAEQAVVVRRQVAGQPPEGFVFRAAMGGPWRHSNFYHRKWQPAVTAAVAKGLPKRPRLHDLRHSHVAWLIAARIPLPVIQVRLGHESIQTTIDRYGHLVDDLADDVLAAVEAAMAGPGAPQRLALVSSAVS